MTAILGFVSVMAERETEPTQLEHLGTIGRNARHLLTILNDILDLSKIEAGRLEFEILPTDVGALLEGCRELVGVQAQAKGVALAIEDAGRGSGPLHTDPVRLRQVVLNLVGNALKFTEAGSVTVGVDAPGPGGSRRVWVRDTGIGMTPEQSRRVLEPFEQADTSTTRIYGGTGLGLAICSRLAARLGGDLCVESAPGVGTTVSFRIDDAGAGAVRDARPVSGAANPPLGVAGAGAAASTGAAAGPARADGARAAPLRGVRVLVVEDGPDNQKLITHYLTRAGAVVDLASDGREGVQRVTDATLAGRAYRVVLMDMQMPVMDGYAATRALRERGVMTPVIALTAHTMAGDREKCLLAGCSDFQGKPIVPAELIACCVRWMDGVHETASAASA
jgi:CheY-like chemotaxis protein